MNPSRFVTPVPRQFYVRIIDTPELTKKEIGIIVLSFLATMSIHDNIEVCEGGDIIVECNFLTAERLKINFEPLVDIKDIVQYNGYITH